MAVKKEENNVNNAKETKDRNEELKKYESINSIWRRYDESYWFSFHMFIIIMGLLLVGYSQVINTSIFSIFLSIIYCGAGMSISLIWLFVLHKKMAFTYIAEEVGRDLEDTIFPDFYKGIFTRAKYTFHPFEKDEKEEKKWKEKREKFLNSHFDKRVIFTQKSSSKLTAFYIPLILIAIWIIILIGTLINGLSDYFCMCVAALIPIGLLFSVLGVIILLIPQIFIKTEQLTPGESPVPRTRKEERPLTILGLIFILIGFILQFIAQF